MPAKVAIGKQDFAKVREQNIFYIDKTAFIKEWWEAGDDVTLITRPRRFGKTLNMSMVECFFSVNYAGRSDLFEGLSVFKEAEYRRLQGTYPVISLSFAGIKGDNFQTARAQILQAISDIYSRNYSLLSEPCMNDLDRQFFASVNPQMSDSVAGASLNKLSEFLCKKYGKKTIILLDEYDTPLQEAYVGGYWQELVSFTRSLFNATFKSNPHLERAIMTGITRISKESIFSDLNNLEVVGTTSEKYADCFGFTQEEVSEALEEQGMAQYQQETKEWYDGFTFGSRTDIYNPWSIVNLLDKKSFATYWANTSSNSLVSKLLREGSRGIKQSFEQLLSGGSIQTALEGQIAFEQLEDNATAIWSLLLASGYLKWNGVQQDVTTLGEFEEPKYELSITNLETRKMFAGMVRSWFYSEENDYNEFIRALLADDVDMMEQLMNNMTTAMFSSFDTGRKPSAQEPERFYHGFVLGLLVELSGRYSITSNRESGYGRYDVMLEPLSPDRDAAIIIEFKVYHPQKEKDLEETVQNALRQIAENHYAANLLAKGIPQGNIRKYGFAFEGKKVRIGKGA